MKNRLRIEGTLTGCAKMRAVWRTLTDQEKDNLRKNIAEAPHMTPCPDEDMWWVVKEDACRYCKFVLVNNQKTRFA